MCCASLCDAWGSFMERRENVKRVPLGPWIFLCVVGYSCAQAMAGRPGCDAIGGHLDLFDPRVESLLLNSCWEVGSFGRSGRCGRRLCIQIVHFRLRTHEVDLPIKLLILCLQFSMLPVLSKEASPPRASRSIDIDARTAAVAARSETAWPSYP